jgi:hypothetical protein
MVRQRKCAQSRRVAEPEYGARGYALFVIPRASIVTAAQISRERALYQSLAASGAAIVAFIGVVHEAAGGLIFPWAPVLLGPVAWHALGLSAIAGGTLIFLGTLNLVRVPVVLFSLLVAVLALVIGVLTAILKHEFHLFAFAAMLAGVTTAYFNRKADK